MQGQFDEARAQFLAALRLAPDLVEAREGLAALCIRLGRYKEGVVHLRELLRADDQRSAIVAGMADALFEIGEVEEAETTPVARLRSIQLRADPIPRWQIYMRCEVNSITWSRH